MDIDLSRVIASDDLLVVNGNIEGHVAGLDLDGNVLWEFDPPDAGPVIMIEDTVYGGRGDEGRRPDCARRGMSKERMDSRKPGDGRDT